MPKRRLLRIGALRPRGRAADERDGGHLSGPASKTGLSAGYLNHLVHGNRPVPSNDVVEQLAKSLDVEAEFFREYRLRVITEKLESMPDLVDRLFRRLNG